MFDTYNNDEVKAKIGARIREIREQKHLSQDEVGSKLNRHQTGIGKIEKDGTMRLDTLQEIANALGVPLFSLLNDDSFSNLSPIADDDTMEVKVISKAFQACAGDGNINDDVVPEYSGTIKVSRAKELSALYSADSLTAMYVEGDSMQPKIYDGDAVVYIEQYEITAQAMPYIVKFHGKCAVKCVETNKKGYLLRSYNKNYEPIQITEDDNFQIIGRVVRIVPASRDPEPYY